MNNQVRPTEGFDRPTPQSNRGHDVHPASSSRDVRRDDGTASPPPAVPVRHGAPRPGGVREPASDRCSACRRWRRDGLRQSRSLPRRGQCPRRLAASGFDPILPSPWACTVPPGNLATKSALTVCNDTAVITKLSVPTRAPFGLSNCRTAFRRIDVPLNVSPFVYSCASLSVLGGTSLIDRSTGITKTRIVTDLAAAASEAAAGSAMTSATEARSTAALGIVRS